MKYLYTLFFVFFSIPFLRAQDIIAPQAKAKPSVSVELGPNGTASLSPAQVDAGSSDNVTSQANLQFSLSQNSFSCSDREVVEEWQYLAGGGISSGVAANQSLGIAPDGTPYVAYQDVENNKKTTVLKWNGSSWEALGGAGISDGETMELSLAVAPDGTPYVAFRDEAHGGKTVVLKWNGSSWEPVGNTGISAGETYDPSLAIDSDGTLYVAYSDVANGRKTTVLKWDGSGWIPLGGGAISAGIAYDQSLSIGPEGTPFVAYSDKADENKTTVLKWNGSSWEALGGAGISSGEARSQSLAVAPDGTPYVAFINYANDYKTTVLKWNGSSWEAMGGAAVSAGGTAFPSLAVSPDGTPFVAFSDIADARKTKVLRWDGSSWIALDGPGISAEIASDQSLAIAPDGTPFVAYQDFTKDDKTKVIKWDGSSWQAVGGAGVSGERSYYQNLAIAPDGTPYVAYIGNANGYKGIVIKWDGSSWETLGGAGISAGKVGPPSLALAPDGTPYVAYEDYVNDNKTTVLKWNGNSWIALGGAGISSGSAWDQSMAIAPDGTPYVAYHDVPYGKGTTVKKWNGSYWGTVGRESFSAGEARYQSLAFAPDGTPYVAYMDFANNHETTVMKWEGNGWETVGVAGISTGGAEFQDLAIAPDGTPYVAYLGKANAQEITVLKWDGANWSTLGGAGFSGGARYPSLAISPDGSPHVAFTDYTNNGETTVMKWDGNGWIALEGAGISRGDAHYQSLAIALDGTPYVAYTDHENGKKTAVQKYYQSNRLTLTVTDEAGNKAIAGSLLQIEDKLDPAPVTSEPLEVEAEGSALLSTAVLEYIDNCSPANSLSYSVTSPPAYGRLELVSTPGQPLTSFTQQQLINEEIRYVHTSTSNSEDNITFSIADENGNSAQNINLTIAILDMTEPVARTKGFTLALTADGTATLEVANVENGSTDNITAAENLGFSLSKTDFSCADLGVQEVTLTVTDEAGNEAVTTAPVVVEDAIEPVIEADQLFSISENAAQGTAIGHVAATENCSLSSWSITDGNSAAAFAIDDDGLLTVTNSAALKNISSQEVALNLKVSDGSNNTSSGAITIQLTEENAAPVLTALSAISADENELISFTAEATDEDNAANELQFSLAHAAPAGAAIDAGTGAFSWTPSEEQGPADYTFSIMVSDGELTDEQELTITVNEVNQAPEITSEPVTEATAGEAYSYQLTATDTDLPANTLSYEASEIPAWLSFDAETQLLSGTPDENLSEDEFLVQLQVDDEIETVVQEFTIRLQKPTGLFGRGEAAESAVLLYPNPTSGAIVLELGEQFKGKEVHLSLFNLEGRLLIQKKGSLEQASGKISSYLSTARGGIYLLQIKGQGQQESIRIRRK